LAVVRAQWGLKEAQQSGCSDREMTLDWEKLVKRKGKNNFR